MNEVLKEYLEQSKGFGSIILPGRKHEDHEYPDLLFDFKERFITGDPDIIVSNYCLRYEVDFLNHLISGKPVYNGAKKEIPREVVNAILNELIGGIRVDFPPILRAQLYNDIYTSENCKMFVTRKIFKDGKESCQIKQEMPTLQSKEGCIQD